MQMLDSNSPFYIVYLDFSKTLTRWNMASFYITQSSWDNWKYCICLFHFRTDISHFVRLPVLSGVPQETVLGPLLFFIMISDIDKDVSASKLVSFVDDTRLYSGVGDVPDCDNIHFDLNAVYDWASSNNIYF